MGRPLRSSMPSARVKRAVANFSSRSPASGQPSRHACSFCRFSGRASQERTLSAAAHGEDQEQPPAVHDHAGSRRPECRVESGSPTPSSLQHGRKPRHHEQQQDDDAGAGDDTHEQRDRPGTIGSAIAARSARPGGRPAAPSASSSAPLSSPAAIIATNNGLNTPGLLRERVGQAGAPCSSLSAFWRGRRHCRVPRLLSGERERALERHTRMQQRGQRACEERECRCRAQAATRRPAHRLRRPARRRSGRAAGGAAPRAQCAGRPPARRLRPPGRRW